MTVLVLRLEGPMQSWGISRFLHRDTHRVPTKSGVAGLLACALGRPWGADMTDLIGLDMAVRVDRAGVILPDFVTIGHFPSLDVHRSYEVGGAIKGPALVTKDYLHDASFLAVLSGDETLLTECAAALQNPVWALYLGRRSCPPSVPVLVGLDPRSTDEVLEDAATRPIDVDGPRAHVVRDTTDLVHAQLTPEIPGANRVSFRARYTTTTSLEIGALTRPGHASRPTKKAKGSTARHTPGANDPLALLEGIL